MNAVILLAAAVTWVDPTCQAYFAPENGKYTYALTDGSAELTCSVDNWSKLDCEDDVAHTIKLIDDKTLEVDGTIFRPKGHKDIICD